MEYLKTTIFLCEQCGFRIKHSCENIMVKLCEKWLNETENKCSMVVVCLDLKRDLKSSTEIVV